MKFTVHTSQSEAVCGSSGGKMISYTHNSISYLWSGDSTDRKGHLPVSFPAASADESVSTDTEALCVLSENDFASGLAFTPVLQMPEKVAFSLEGNPETRAVFPCRFQLTHTYTVNDHGFSAKFTLQNRDKKPMVYRFGTEPVFSLPLAKGASPDDYRLEIAASDSPAITENREGNVIRDFACLDGSSDNIIRLADISSEITTLAVNGPVEKQIKLFSEKTGQGLQLDLVGFRSLAVQLYKNQNASHIYLKLLNYIPASFAEMTAEKNGNPQPNVPVGGEYTVGYVVTIL